MPQNAPACYRRPAVLKTSSVIRVGLNATILAVTEEAPRVLTATHERSALPPLPFGPLDPLQDRTLELGLRGWVRGQTGFELGYVEQLYTFGDLDRDPYADVDGRVISVAYLALVREAPPALGSARWRDVYAFLPWEDFREGPPNLVTKDILPALDAWAKGSPPRQERYQVAFGAGESRWDPERVLERYELLWESELLDGKGMALDHRRILATALGRLRAKIRYRPVVFELMPETFTLLQLQRVVEALAGVRLHKQNFRRLLENGGLVEGTGETFTETRGRPAELFRFRRHVVRERPSAGVAYPSRA